MSKNKKIDSFFEHFPPKVAEYCFQLWHDHPFDFIISKARHSKLGDYRFSPTKGHQITVNHNLNPYAFLVTYLHEVAHLLTYKRFKNKVSPHGQEWKSAFKELFQPILDEEFLPDELIKVLRHYLINPTATSTGHGPLVHILKTYDKIDSNLVAIDTLKENQLFGIKNLQFIKGKLRRTRYICKEITTGKFYLVSKNAQVSLFDIENQIP
jgi:SprT protein